MKRKQRIDHNKYYQHKFSAKKIKKVKNKLFSVVGITFLVFVIIFLGTKVYGLFTSSDLFKIKQIELTGVSGELKLRMKRAIPLITGDNYFLFNTNLVTKRLSALFPEIKTVKIEKIFPKRIVCRINLRQPLAVVKQDNKVERLDAEGTVFNCFLQEKLPEIKNKQNLNMMLEFLDWMRKNHPNFFQRICDTYSTTENEISFSLVEGTKIYWGKCDLNLREEKLSRINLIWRDWLEKKKEIEYIDFRFCPESGVVVMPRSYVKAILSENQKLVAPKEKTEKKSELNKKKKP